ncbi:hypothetical protein CYMTET_42665 [Cymbomonas tetramitiformis]|uniref:Uncharacterized protein n=1 Tax=Cymbomonas tetramitiformis TaxID=36881 RepID=A0AAE0F0R9_9CHLO|nr:hypothetical protein CYMTET_42665 [Cymbomonas tetramitiformis]
MNWLLGSEDEYSDPQAIIEANKAIQSLVDERETLQKSLTQYHAQHEKLESRVSEMEAALALKDAELKKTDNALKAQGEGIEEGLKLATALQEASTNVISFLQTLKDSDCSGKETDVEKKLQVSSNSG